MDNAKQRFRLGALVIGAAALLATLSVFFGGTPRLFQLRARYTIVFSDAPGVVRGTPVRKSGVRIGEVESVELDDKRNVVKVFIAVDPQYSIRDSEEPVIVPDLLSRDTTIDFVPITPPSPPKPQTKLNPVVPAQFVQAQPEPGMGPQPAPGKVLPPGSEIRGRVPIDVRALIREATEVVPSVQMSINQIRKSVERFERLAPIIEDTMREYTELARAMREIVPEVRRTNEELRVALKKVSDLDPDVRRALDELQDLVRQYKRVGERVDVLLQTNNDAIDKTIRNVSTVVQRMMDLLNDENQKNFAASLKSMQGLAKSLEGLAGQAQKETLPRFQDTLAKLDSVLLNVNTATKPFADRAERISRNIDAATEQVARLLGTFSDTFGQPGKADGSIQRLLTDPSLYNNLNDASLMLTRILPRVDRMLKDFEVFADKIARHPESLGVGGAVRPSAGLKDPPGAPITNYKPHQ
jgi:phospholipid/cholesterol/gamma-HCH transport system substrate-binding protein